MKTRILIFSLILLFPLVSAEGVDTTIYIADAYQPACLFYSDMKMVLDAIIQDDKIARDKMIDNKRCMYFKGGEEMFVVDSIDYFSKVRLKGGTLELWTVITSNKKKKKHK